MCCNVLIGEAHLQDGDEFTKVGSVMLRPDGLWEVDCSRTLEASDRVSLRLFEDLGSFEVSVSAAVLVADIDARFETGSVKVDGLLGELRVFGRQEYSKTLIFEPPMADVVEQGLVGEPVANLYCGTNHLGWIYQWNSGDYDVLWSGEQIVDAGDVVLNWTFMDGRRAEERKCVDAFVQRIGREHFNTTEFLH